MPPVRLRTARVNMVAAERSPGMVTLPQGNDWTQWNADEMLTAIVSAQIRRFHIFRPDDVERPIASGIDVNDLRDRDGQTPLQQAAAFGAERSVELLLAAGADVDRRDADGNSVLHVAEVYGAPSVGEALIAAGADPSAEDNAGRTPAELAELYVEDVPASARSILHRAADLGELNAALDDLRDAMAARDRAQRLLNALGPTPFPWASLRDSGLSHAGERAKSRIAVVHVEHQDAATHVRVAVVMRRPRGTSAPTRRRSTAASFTRNRQGSRGRTIELEPVHDDAPRIEAGRRLTAREPCRVVGAETLAGACRRLRCRRHRGTLPSRRRARQPTTSSSVPRPLLRPRSRSSWTAIRHGSRSARKHATAGAVMAGGSSGSDVGEST